MRECVKCRDVKSGEARMVTPAMTTTMIGSIYSLQINGAQHGGHVFHLRLSTFQRALVT